MDAADSMYFYVFLPSSLHKKTPKPFLLRKIPVFMASLGRFERPAPALGEQCSIQLSYRDI